MQQSLDKPERMTNSSAPPTNSAPATGGRFTLDWEFAEPDGKDQLQVDQLDWTQPSALEKAELIKENVHRQVWQVKLAGTSYYVKLYLRHGRWWFLKRLFRGPACVKEWRVAKYAMKKNVNCVRPVAYAISKDPVGKLDCLLVTKGLSDALQLTKYWQQLFANGTSNRSDTLRRLKDALAELLAKTHQAGIAHSDLHPGNLLVRGPANGNDQTTDASGTNAHLVDLHSVRTGRAVSDRLAAANLAQLNQWFRQNATVSQRMRLLKRYLVFRGLLGSQSNGMLAAKTFRRWVRSLDRAATNHARRLYGSRDRRVMRTGKYFAKLTLNNRWKGHVFLRSKHGYPCSTASKLVFTLKDWKPVLARPQELIESLLRQSRPIKNSRSTLVCKGQIQVGPHKVSVVCKRQIRRKRFAAIWDCLRHSRSLRAWKISFAMLHRTLPVALPLAVLERRFGPYLADSLLITEEVTPSVNLRVFLTTILPVLNSDQRRQVTHVLTDQLQQLLRKMHRHGFVHRDMKATNILIYGATVENCKSLVPSTLRIVLIDLDGLSLKRRASLAEQLRALARLSISADLSPYITQTDRARFLKAYLTRYGSGSADWKKLWRQIETERENRFQDHLAG